MATINPLGAPAPNKLVAACGRAEAAACAAEQEFNRKAKAGEYASAADMTAARRNAESLRAAANKAHKTATAAEGKRAAAVHKAEADHNNTFFEQALPLLRPGLFTQKAGGGNE